MRAWPVVVVDWEVVHQNWGFSVLQWKRKRG